MPEPLTGELVRHNNKKFYQQQTSPKLFWTGCLAPLLLIAMFGFLIYQGAKSSLGLDTIRGFIIFIVVFLLLQLVFGGGLFFKNKSSLGRGLLASAGVVILLLMLALIGIGTLINNFIH